MGLYPSINVLRFYSALPSYLCRLMLFAVPQSFFRDHFGCVTVAIVIASMIYALSASLRKNPRISPQQITVLRGKTWRTPWILCAGRTRRQRMPPHWYMFLAKLVQKCALFLVLFIHFLSGRPADNASWSFEGPHWRSLAGTTFCSWQLIAARRTCTAFSSVWNWCPVLSLVSFIRAQGESAL